MSGSYNLASTSFILERASHDEDELLDNLRGPSTPPDNTFQRGGFRPSSLQPSATQSNAAPTIILPSPVMRRQRLDQSRSRGTTPVTQPRSLHAQFNRATKLDDVIDLSDTTSTMSAERGCFSTALADRDLIRKKIPLKPEFSLTVWCDKEEQLPIPLQREITEDELAEHARETDCWIAIHGAVYDVTEYLPFHPGGKDILVEYGGKDSTGAFDITHAFVNVSFILQKRQVGILKRAPKNLAAVNDFILE